MENFVEVQKDPVGKDTALVQLTFGRPHLREQHDEMRNYMRTVLIPRFGSYGVDWPKVEGDDSPVIGSRYTWIIPIAALELLP
jgi:hypothetical protein